MTFPQGTFEYFVSCLVVGLVGWVAMYVGTRRKEPAKKQPANREAATTLATRSPEVREGLHLVEAKPEREAEKVKVLCISRRDGGKVTPREAAIVTAATKKFVAESEEFKLAPALPAVTAHKMNGTWAQEGRALVHTSHNVAHHPVRLSHSAAVGALSKGVAK